MWANSAFDALVDEAVRCNRKFPKASASIDEKHLHRVFNRLVLEGRTRTAVRRVTDRDGGRPRLAHEVADPAISDHTVGQVLSEKHPEQKAADHRAFMECDHLPDMYGIEVPERVVEKAARSIQGSAGPVGGDSQCWGALLLKHGAASSRLRRAVGALAEKLANTLVEWEFLRALRSCRLIALDKGGGKIRPIGIGETLFRIVGKSISAVTGDELSEACGIDQLCGGISAGIEAAIHSMTDKFEDSATQGMLMVDATNAFNVLSRPAALWNVRVLWPRAARFLFNTYSGYAELWSVGEQEPILSKEGTTQGDPMAMMYAAATLPLVKAL